MDKIEKSEGHISLIDNKIKLCVAQEYNTNEYEYSRHAAVTATKNMNDIVRLLDQRKWVHDNASYDYIKNVDVVFTVRNINGIFQICDFESSDFETKMTHDMAVKLIHELDGDMKW